ncbi:MAG: hypothetical protein ACOYT4_00165 [Nanoarchaeota archaeon]
MINSQPPYTLTRIANSHKGLEEVLGLYKEGFVPIEMGITEKFLLYNPSSPQHLIMISQQKKGVDLQNEYNVLLTITSDDSSLNKKIAEEIAEKTKIGFYDAPPNQSDFMSNLNFVFPVFKKYGLQAIEVLKAMGKIESSINN